jgi:hypothetical protein
VAAGLGLRSGVRSRESLPGTLHREPELVQEARHGVVVESDLEPVFDQIGDHRSRPNPSAVPGGDGTVVDELGQFLRLLRRQFGRQAGRRECSEPRNAVLVVPRKPPIHGPASHAQLLGQVHNTLAVDVPKHCATSSPFVEASFLVRARNESL